MKHNLNKSYLLGGLLLSSFLVIGLINITNGSDTVSMPSSSASFNKIEHRTRLHSLYLWSNKSLTGAGMNVFTGRTNLDVINGLLIGTGGDASGTGVVGGGFGNHIYGRYSGIGGGNGNKVSDYSFVGGGKDNDARGSDSVVVGGQGNWNFGGVVVGGKNNITNGGVALGGEGANSIDQYKSINSLVLGGKTAKAAAGSFSWRADNSKENTARIQANNGVRIGDVSSVLTSVPLYVNGAVKVGDSSLGTKGEIKSDVADGCIRGNDGVVYQTFGRASGGGKIEGEDDDNPCGSLDSCQFGSVFIPNGEKVKASREPYVVNGDCSYNFVLTCEDGVLTCGTSGVECKTPYYVACHRVNSSDPVYGVKKYVGEQ